MAVAHHGREFLRALVLAGAVALLALLVAGEGQPAYAANITVNGTADVIADDGVCTLREAITAANTDASSGATAGECAAGSGADTIDLPAGTYTLSIAGNLEDANATGDLDITTDLAINGDGQVTTIIDGAALDRVLHIHTGSTVELAGLTIRNGRASGGSGPNSINGGGGIHIRSATLTLSNSTVSGNTASEGGGILTQVGSTLTLNNSTVSGNATTNPLSGFGGGIASQSATQLTLNNSTVSGNTAVGAGGGGIGNFSGPATLNNSTVSDNTATKGGGLRSTGNSATQLTLNSSTVSGNTSSAIAGGIEASDGPLTLTDSTVSGNTSGSQAGGIWNRDTMTLNSSTVSGNTAVMQGGGIVHSVDSPATLNNSTVSGNTSNDNGGGILNRGTMTLNSSTVSGNAAVTGGGGIVNVAIVFDATLTLNSSTVSDNTAGSNGGGIENVSGATVTLSNSTVTLNNSTVTGNTAGADGGGIRTVTLNNSTVTLNNSTVTGNTAGADGGGIFYRARFSSTLALNNSTVTGNSAPTGGGIARFFTGDASRAPTLKNTIVANSPSGGDCSGIITSLGHNLSSDITCNLTASGDLQNTNPLLGALQNNGGPTETHALLAGSPAIDAGSGDCPPPTTDQRGVVRPQGAACDIGAFELVADSDGDGVLDVDDLCPDTAAGAAVDANGCSDAQVDGDGDGICDLGAPSDGPSGCTGSDICPSENSTGFDADNDGCIDDIRGLNDLIDTLFDEGVIDSTMQNSLHAKIDNALKSLDKDKVCTAINQLNALKAEIEAQTGKKVSADAAPELLQYITNVQTFLVMVSGVSSCPGM